eukprot:SAG31_NODE_16854_length_693_cov_0.720539_1_plen_123_part_10
MLIARCAMLHADGRPVLAVNEAHSLHDGPMNENAGRVEACIAELHRSGLWGRCELVTAAPAMAQGDELHAKLLHTAEHLASLAAACATAGARAAPPDSNLGHQVNPTISNTHGVPVLNSGRRR